MDLQELREVSRIVTPEMIRMLELAQNADLSVLPVPSDKLILQGEAANVLGVGKPMISRYVNEGLLDPVYTPHCKHRKFWLSEVKALVSKEMTE